VWNDLGEGLFNMDWYGALFGALPGGNREQAAFLNFRVATARSSTAIHR